MRKQILLLLALALVFTGACSKPGGIASCEEIQPGPELTFGMSYCQGDMCEVTCDENGDNCHTVTTKEECEGIDVVSEKNLEIFNPDGKPDCEWKEELLGQNILSACKPNK